VSDDEIVEDRDADGLLICWNRHLPRRVWLNPRPREVWLLPSPEAALARLATADDETDTARWTRKMARMAARSHVMPLPVPEDATGFFTVAVQAGWLSGGWIQ